MTYRLTLAVSVACMTLGCGSKSTGTPDAASTADAGPCPDQHGAYSIVLSGQGCGDLNASAPQCIMQTNCAITFASNPPAGTKAMNGTASLMMDGSFTSAAITEGTSNRTGCVGAWNAATSTLTVDCGGVGSSQSCRATLTRTSTTCN